MTTTATCCSRPMRRVEIETRAAVLTLLACSRCDTSTWLADGGAADRDQILAAMSSVGRAPRVA